jgi:hypothetical protein
MNKFILYSLLLLSLLGIASSTSPQDFDPIERHDRFKPSTNLRATYAQRIQDGGRHMANIHFKTKMPSFNLDQNDVYDIDCKDGKIIVSLGNHNSIEKIKNWPDKVFVLVSHKWKCYGKKSTQYYIVGHRTIDSHNKKVTFTAKKSDIEDMSEEFDINISWEDKKNKKHHNNRRQFGIGDFDVDPSAKIPLNVFFDEKTGKSSKKFTLIEVKQNNNKTSQSLVCDNCFTNGQATVSLNLAGTIIPPRLKKATLSLDGNLRINLGVSFNGKITKSISTRDFELISIPLSPFNIPGILTVGPTLDVISSATISAALSGSIRTGLEISYPKFSAKAIFNDINNPKFVQSGFNPITKPLDSSFGGVTASASISGTLLKPQIAFGIDILKGRIKRKAGFEVAPTLTAEVIVGKGSGCKKLTQPKLRSKISAKLGFFAEKLKFLVFEIPIKTLLDKCFF